MKRVVLTVWIFLCAMIVFAQDSGDARDVLMAERAALSNPRDAAALAALQQAFETPNASVIPYRLSDMAAALLNFQEHSALVFILWGGFHVVVAFGAFSPRLRSLLAPVRVLILSGLVIWGGWFALRLVADTIHPRAVVMIAASLRVGADESFLVVDTLQAAQRVRVLQFQSDWAFVIAMDGRSGWLPAKTIELVIPQRDSTTSE